MLSANDTPDGRPGVSLLLFGVQPGGAAESSR